LLTLIKNKLFKDQKGLSTLQLALVMPILLAILTGIFEIGVVNTYWNNLQDIKGTTIRAMAKNGGMNNTILAWSQDQLQSLGMDPAQCTIKASWAPVQRNDMLEMEIVYPYRFIIFGGFNSNVGFDVNLTAKGVALSEKYFR
jgi:Flp pilus assembly protein TadG